MQSQFIEDASKLIPSPQMLINVISKRVRQLASGHRPMIDTGVGMSFSDTALQEVIQGKLTYEEASDEAKES